MAWSSYHSFSVASRAVDPSFLLVVIEETQDMGNAGLVDASMIFHCKVNWERLHPAVVS
jgi:hypothetical protein